MTQKRVLCIKMFSKLSEQIDDLNFTTVQYSLHWSSKSMRHKKIAIRSSRRFTALQTFTYSSTCQISSPNTEWSMHRNVQYFIRSKPVVLNFVIVRYSLHKCSLC